MLLASWQNELGKKGTVSDVFIDHFYLLNITESHNIAMVLS